MITITADEADFTAQSLRACVTSWRAKLGRMHGNGEYTDTEAVYLGARITQAELLIQKLEAPIHETRCIDCGGAHPTKEC